MNAERPTRLRWSRALCRCPPWSREASPEIKKKRSGFDQGPVRVLAGCLSAHLLRKTALGSIEQAQRSTDTPARSQLTACACGNVTQRSFAGARPKRPPPRSVEVRPRAAQPKKTQPTMPPRRKKDPPSFKPSAETLKNFQMPEETPQLELLPSGPKGDIPSTYTGECRALNQPAVLPPPPPPSRKEERPSASQSLCALQTTPSRKNLQKPPWTLTYLGSRRQRPRQLLRLQPRKEQPPP